MMQRLLPWLAALTLLAGCSSITDLKSDISERMFGREPADPPTPLVAFKPRAQSRVMWSVKVGEAEDFTFTPAVQNGQVYAASATGDVFRIDANNGHQVWHVNAGEKLSGGVGLGDNLVLVGTPTGYVIAFDQSGKLLWKSKVSSEVLSVPRVSGDMVVVRAGDSRIFGLSAIDGSRKWIYQRVTPTLSLRSSAGVAIDGGAVYVGFAGGKLIALRLEDGKIIWEASVAQPRGVTEIERIADITSLPVVDGPLVYAVAYQGKIAAVDRATGRVVWSRDISSYTGLGAEDARLFVAHANGGIYALDYSSGKTFWKQDDLFYRHPTAPLPMGGVVAVGDVEGYVHFLDREDGSFYSRVQTSDSPIMARMTELGPSGLLAQTRDGGLYAISIK
ncbi:MAG TPA: outer membrane protein assembly factor BamB [Methylophilaceae bacterium]|nr:outer membrane protein assembly factor BamB [Methylophilaceae bacterium]